MTLKNLLEGLNSEQQKAVENIEGAMMVIAGAGSGKTRVLTYRIAYMISQGINPFDILSLTFTNKAAAEMKERIIDLLGNTTGRNVWMAPFTLFSVAYYTLNRNTSAFQRTLPSTIKTIVRIWLKPLSKRKT